MKKCLFFCFMLVIPTLLLAQSEPIKFANDRVRKYSVKFWDTNGDGELSYDEAAAVTTLDTVFRYKSEIHGTFRELRHFTGLRKINALAFSDCHWMTAIELPPTIDTICYRAFWSCIRVDTLLLPKTLHVIEPYGFYHCMRLKEINIPGTVDSIPTATFMWCEEMKTATINEGTRIIGPGAFAHCESLQYIYLPSTIISVGDNVLTGSIWLRQVVIRATVPPAATDKSFGKDVVSNAVLYVPEGTIKAYRKAPGWRRFKYISELF